MITWGKIIEAEPRLLELYWEARDTKPADAFALNRIWYAPNGFKSELINLVGFQAAPGKPEFMQTWRAYDISYEKIYWTLLTNL